MLRHRIYQRNTDLTDPHKGDCLAACVATVLGLTLDDVPNFCSAEGDWWGQFQLWLSRYNLVAIEVVASFAELAAARKPLPIANLTDGTPVILTGSSPRGDWNHSVVAIYEATAATADMPARASFLYVHDPHPAAGDDPHKWLVGLPTQMLVFGLLNPSKHLALVRKTTNLSLQ